MTPLSRAFAGKIRNAAAAVLKTAVKTMKDPVKSGSRALQAETATPNAYLFGPYRLEVGKRRLWRGNQLVPLTRKAFDTLLALVQRAGHVVDRDDLLRMVWPDTFITEETLTQNIATIRRALGDSSEQPEYVATIPRRGYQFVGVVKAELSNGITPSSLADVLPPVERRNLPEVETRHVRELPVTVGVQGQFLLGALVAVIVVLGLGFTYYRNSRAPEMPFGGEWHINPPPGTTLVTGGAMSPDGRSLAFVTIDPFGTTALWVQALGSLDAVRLPDTEGARAPIWLAGGQSLVFNANRKLKQVRLSDKTVQTLASITLADFKDHGGASGAGGVVYATTEGGPLQKRDAAGMFVQATRLAEGERVHMFPSFLPDGRHFVYRAAAFDDSRSGTYVGSLDSPVERTRLDGIDSAAMYASGYLVFLRDGALVAQKFDSDRRRLEGMPQVLARRVAPSNEADGLTFSASGNVVSYIVGGAHDVLAWFDRAGRRLTSLDTLSDMENPSLSPDDAVVLGGRAKAEVGNEIWAASTTSGTPWRLQTGLTQSGLTAWSGDGKQILITSAGSLYSLPAVGGHAELLMKPPTREQPLRVQDWSRDGRFLIFISFGPGTKTDADLSWFSMADHKTGVFVNSLADEGQAQFSPDGHWLAYTSNEAEQFEVYVQRFPEGGSKQKVSISGGAQPKWRRDGKELFYLSLENKLMSVDVHLGSEARFGVPHELFQIPLHVSVTTHRNDYAVSRDGNRFLFSIPPANPRTITVRLNWTAALQQ